MRIRKHIAATLITMVTTLLLITPMVAHAGIELDLIPDEAEDKLCEGLDEGTGGILSCEDDTGDITSFTEFEGSFDAPSTEGYDEGLTQATSAREFILNVTNFFLSFLGLAAIAVIIYGGFLYVTAGGQDEQMQKGKKSVMYAIIGILIVLSSYAIVNTLISDAAGGGEDRDSSSIYSSGDEVTGEEIDAYNVNEIAQDLQNIASEYIDVYTTYSNVYTYIEYGQSVDAPDVEMVSSIVNWLWEDSETPADEEDMKLVREYVELMDEVVQEIMDMVDRYSDTYEAAEDMKAYTESILYDASWDKMYSSNNSWIPKAYAEGDTYYEYGDFEDLEEDITEGFKVLKKAANVDFNETIGEYNETLKTYRNLFDTGEEIGVSVTLTAIIDQFNVLVKDGEGYFSGEGESRNRDTDDFIEASVFREVIDELGILYAMVENLEFVTGVITASASEGNSPFIISFDCLESYDPSDLSIDGDTQCYWDLEGEGYYDTTGDALSYTYDEVGTYRVGLRVTSQDEDIAPGQSYLSITVNPPESNIVVTATAGSRSVELANYEDGLNKTSAIFTESEGLAGITISLDGTTDGTGEDTVYHTLDCGNGEEFESENVIEEVCYYTQAGQYDLRVEVTDMKGNTDRYVGTVKIKSPAASILTSKYSGDLNAEFTFDGSASATDVGTITNYTWSAISVDGAETTLSSEAETETIFDTPGIYTISLTVTDSAGEQDTDSIEITVESTPPVAKFDYSIPDSTQPGTVHFDAGDSYDPDPEDVISFSWTFEGEEGTDFTFMENTNATLEEPIVKFASAGSQDVTLEVYDQYEDDDLRQSTEVTNEVTIASVLDISLSLPDGLAHQLDDETGEVEVSFLAESENAEAFEIDFGDGDGDAAEGVSGSKTFTHTYDETGTYEVEVAAYDEDNNENTYTKKVYIGDSESPISVISIEKDGSPISNLSIDGNTETVFTFDASESKNTNGTSRNLKFSWDFGDNTLSTEKTASHTYEEVGIYEVMLTVSDEDDPSLKSEDTFEITIAEDPPEISSLTYSVTSESMTTPVEISVEVDAEDPDGSIANYYWYYYDTSNTTDKLGAQITETSSTTMTISTRGTTGEEKEYGLVVEVSDKAGNTVSSQDALSEDPTIEVENGENEAPVAEFSVSDTVIMLGDAITLSSSSYDPDDDAITYIWDLEGDGFSDNEETEEATLTFAPEISGCYEIKLKVIDENEQSTTSDDSIEICVESLTENAEAAFVSTVTGFDVEFENTSTIDTENGAELYAAYWDFDANTDSDGNGDATDDIDSEEENPTHTYDAEGDYTVKLTVYDTAGSSDDVEHTITIEETDPPTAAFVYEADDLDVSFENNSETAASSVTIESFAWDFDILTDSDGDGDAENDVDSEEENPAYSYDDYGIYTAKLTIIDSMEKEDFVTRIVELEEPVIDIEGYLNTNPAASASDSKVHLSGESGSIDISYSTNLDSGEGITCWIDKNVYYDTDGNGTKDDDHDLEDTSCTQWTFYDVYYEASWGLMVMMLTVEDTVHDSSYSVTKEIVFDTDETGGANIFPVSGAQGLILIMVAVSFALLGASIYTVKRIN